MARDPGSLWSPLTENGRQGSNIKTQFIVHSTGTRATAAANRAYFNRADIVVESTFIVGRGPEDPTVQIMDSAQTADANGSANRRGISVEVVGTGADDYTEWQITELVRLGRWAAAAHPIALRIIPSEAGSGFGWHVMFGAPGPWTTARGKECPGVLRTRRLRERVFPAIFNGSNQQEDDVELRELIEFRPSYNQNLWDSVKQIQANQSAHGQQLAELRAQIASGAGGVVPVDEIVNRVLDGLAARIRE